MEEGTKSSCSDYKLKCMQIPMYMGKILLVRDGKT